MKRLVAVLALAAVMVLTGCRDGKDGAAAKGALRTLQNLGVDIDESVLPEVTGRIESMKSKLAGSGFPKDILDIYSSDQYLIYSMLQYIGWGCYGTDGEWTPLSRKVYAFDAEVEDVEHMYTQFLKGVQAIVPDIEIADVAEDLSGITDEVYSWVPVPRDGTRSVSFTCNGHPYSVELKSYLDWIDMDIVSFMNDVLEKERCPKSLYVISDDIDQIVIMIYGSKADADKLKPYARYM